MVVGSSGLTDRNSPDVLMNPSSPTTDQFLGPISDVVRDSVSGDNSWSNIEGCEDKLPFPLIPPFLGYSYTSPYSTTGQTLVSNVRLFSMKLVLELDNHIILMDSLCVALAESQIQWEFILKHKKIVMNSLSDLNVGVGDIQDDSQGLLMGIDPVLLHKMLQSIAPHVRDEESGYVAKYQDLNECVTLLGSLHTLVDKCVLSSSGLVEGMEFGEIQCSDMSSLCLYCDSFHEDQQSIVPIVAPTFQSFNQGQPSLHTLPAYQYVNDVSSYNRGTTKLSGCLNKCPHKQLTVDGLVCTASQQGQLHSLTVPQIHSAGIEENSESVQLELDTSAYTSYRHMIYNLLEYHLEEDKTALDTSVDPFVLFIAQQYATMKPLISLSNQFTNQSELLLVRQFQVLQVSLSVLRQQQQGNRTLLGGQYGPLDTLQQLLLDLTTLILQRPCFFPSNMQQFTTRSKQALGCPATVLTTDTVSVQTAWMEENDLVSGRIKQFLTLVSDADAVALQMSHQTMRVASAPHLPAALAAMSQKESSSCIRSRRLLSATMSLLSLYQEVVPEQQLGLGSCGARNDLLLNFNVDTERHAPKPSSTEHFILAKLTPPCPVKNALRSIADQHWSMLPQLATVGNDNEQNTNNNNIRENYDSYLACENNDKLARMRIQPSVVSSTPLPSILDSIAVDTRGDTLNFPSLSKPSAVPSLTNLWGKDQRNIYYGLHEYVRAGLHPHRTPLNAMFVSNVPKITLNHIYNEGASPNEHLNDLSLLPFPQTSKDRSVLVQLLYLLIPNDTVSSSDLVNIPLFLQNTGLYMQAFTNLLHIAEQQTEMNLILTDKNSTDKLKYASTKLLRESQNCDILRHMKMLLRQSVGRSPNSVGVGAISMNGNTNEASCCNTNTEATYPTLLTPEPCTDAYIMNNPGPLASHSERSSMDKQSSLDWSSNGSKDMTYRTIHAEYVDSLLDDSQDMPDNCDDEDVDSGDDIGMTELTHSSSHVDSTAVKEKAFWEQASETATVEELITANPPPAIVTEVDSGDEACSLRNPFRTCDVRANPLHKVLESDGLLYFARVALKPCSVLEFVNKESKTWANQGLLQGFPYIYQGAQGAYKLFQQDSVPTNRGGAFLDQFGSLLTQIAVLVANTFTLSTLRQQMTEELHADVFEVKAEICCDIEAWLVVWLHAVQTAQCPSGPHQSHQHGAAEFSNLLGVLWTLRQTSNGNKTLICTAVTELIGQLLDSDILLAHTQRSFALAVVGVGAILKSLLTLEDSVLLNLRKTIIHSISTLLMQSMVRLLHDYTTVQYVVDCPDFATGMLQNQFETVHRMTVDHILQLRRLALTAAPSQEGLLLAKLPLHVIHLLLKPSDGERRGLQDTALKYMTSDSGEPVQKVLQPEIHSVLSEIAKQKFDPSFCLSLWLIMHRVLAYNVSCTPQTDSRPGTFVLYTTSCSTAVNVVTGNNLLANSNDCSYAKAFFQDSRYKTLLPMIRSKPVVQICVYLPAPPLLSPFASLQPQFMTCMNANPAHLTTRALPQSNLCDSPDVLHPHSIPSSAHAILSWILLKNTPIGHKKATSTMLAVLDQLFHPTHPPVSVDAPFQVGEQDVEEQEDQIKDLIAAGRDIDGSCVGIGNYTLYNYEAHCMDVTFSNLCNAFLPFIHKYPTLLLSLRAFAPIAHSYLCIPAIPRNSVAQLTSSGLPAQEASTEAISGTFWHEIMVTLHNSAAHKQNRLEKRVHVTLNRLAKPHEAAPVYSSIAHYQSFCNADSELACPLPYVLHNQSTDNSLDLETNEQLAPEFLLPHVAVKNLAMAPCLQSYAKYKHSVGEMRLFFLHNVVSSVEREVHESRYIRHTRIQTTSAYTTEPSSLPLYLTVLAHHSKPTAIATRSVSSLLVHSLVHATFRAIYPVRVTALPVFTEPLSLVNAGQLSLETPSFPDLHLAESTTIVPQADLLKQTVDILQRQFSGETSFLAQMHKEEPGHMLSLSQVRVPYGVHTLMAVTHNAAELIKNTAIMQSANSLKGTAIASSADETSTAQIVSPHTALACHALQRQTVLTQARSAIRRCHLFTQLNALYAAVAGSKQHVQFQLLRQRVEDYYNNTNLLPGVIHAVSNKLSAIPILSLLNTLVSQSSQQFTENVTAVLFLDAPVPEFSTQNIQTYLQQPYIVLPLLFLAQVQVGLVHTQYGRLYTPVSIHGRPVHVVSPAREFYGSFETHNYLQWYRQKMCSYLLSNFPIISHDLHNALFRTEVSDTSANVWEVMQQQSSMLGELAIFVQTKGQAVSSEMQFLLNHTVNNAFLFPNLTRTQMLSFLAAHKPVLQDSDVRFLLPVASPRVRAQTETVVPFPAPSTLPQLYTKDAAAPQASYQTQVLLSSLNAMYNGSHSYIVHPVFAAEQLTNSVFSVALISSFAYLRTAWFSCITPDTAGVQPEPSQRARSRSEVGSKKAPTEHAKNALLQEGHGMVSFSAYVQAYVADLAEASTGMLLSQLGLARVGTVVQPSVARTKQRQAAKALGLPSVEWHSFAPQSVSQPQPLVKNFYRPQYQSTPPGFSCTHLLSQHFHLPALIHKNMRGNTSMTSLSQYLALYHVRRDSRERMKTQVFANACMTKARSQEKLRNPIAIHTPTSQLDFSRGVPTYIPATLLRLLEGPCVSVTFQSSPQTGQTVLHSHMYMDAVAEEYVDSETTPLTTQLTSQLPTHSSVLLLLRVLSIAQCLNGSGGGVAEAHSALLTDFFPTNLKLPSQPLPFCVPTLRGALPTSVRFHLPLEHIPQTLRFLLHQQHISSLCRILTTIFRLLPSLYGAQRQAFLCSTVLDPEIFNGLFFFWFGDVRKLFHYILLYRVGRSADPAHYDIPSLFAKYFEEYSAHRSTLAIRKQALNNSGLISTIDLHAPALLFNELQGTYRSFLSSPLQGLTHIPLPKAAQELINDHDMAAGPQSTRIVSSPRSNTVQSTNNTTKSVISNNEVYSDQYKNRPLAPAATTEKKATFGSMLSSLLPSWMAPAPVPLLTPSFSEPSESLSAQQSSPPLTTQPSNTDTLPEAVYAPTVAALPTPSVALGSIECNHALPGTGTSATGYLQTVPEIFIDMQCQHYARQIVEYYHYQVWRHFVLSSVHKGYMMAHGYIPDPTVCPVCVGAISLTEIGDRLLHEHSHRFPLTPTLFSHLTAFQLSSRQLSVAADALSEYAAHTIVFIHLNYRFSIAQLKAESLIAGLTNLIGTDLARIHATELLATQSTHAKAHRLAVGSNATLALNVDPNNFTISTLLDSYLSSGVICSSVSGLESVSDVYVDCHKYTPVESIPLVSGEDEYRLLPSILPAQARCVIAPRISSVHPLPTVYPYDYTAPETSHSPLQFHRHHKHSVTPKREKKPNSYVDVCAADIDDTHIGTCLAAFFKSSIRAAQRYKTDTSVFHKTERDLPDDVKTHPYASPGTAMGSKLSKLHTINQHFADGQHGTTRRSTDKATVRGASKNSHESRDLTGVTVSKVSKESLLNSQKRNRIPPQIGNTGAAGIWHSQTYLPAQELTAVYSKLLQRLRPYVWKFLITPRSLLLRQCGMGPAGTLTMDMPNTQLAVPAKPLVQPNTLVPLLPKPLLLRCQPIHPLPAAVHTGTGAGQQVVASVEVRSSIKKGKLVNIVESNFANIFYHSSYVLAPRLPYPQDK